MKSLISYVTSLCFLSLFLTSCEKKELPVPAHDPGNVVTATADMDATYKWQIYYNLKTNTIIGKNLKTAWDLGFEATPEGYHVILNSSKSMFALNTGKKNFDLVSFPDTVGFAANKRWDAPNGSVDSTAIGDWRTDQNVYILDRGYNELGQSLGLEKIQIAAVSNSSYSVCFSGLGNTNKVTLTIEKDSAYNFTFLSFDNGGNTILVEPPKADWDIVFTQYTHVFYNPVMPYLVTGCLLNRYRTSACIDTFESFKQINYNSVSRKQLSSFVNVIGYDWKTYTGSSYITNTKMNYMVKNATGLYFKLHFTNFYNSSGVKGNPTWEYQQL